MKRKKERILKISFFVDLMFVVGVCELLVGVGEDFEEVQLSFHSIGLV
jgi:hypothetical protein